MRIKKPRLGILLINNDNSYVDFMYAFLSVVFCRFQFSVGWFDKWRKTEKIPSCLCLICLASLRSDRYQVE